MLEVLLNTRLLSTYARDPLWSWPINCQVLIRQLSEELRSGDYASHSMRTICLSSSHFWTDFAVWFGSLSCINYHRKGISHSAYGSITFSSISWYRCWSVVSFNQKIGPTPCQEKHPQTMLPPPCFTVLTVYWGLKVQFAGLRTQVFTRRVRKNSLSSRPTTVHCAISPSVHRPNLSGTSRTWAGLADGTVSASGLSTDNAQRVLSRLNAAALSVYWLRAAVRLLSCRADLNGLKLYMRNDISEPNEHQFRSFFSDAPEVRSEFHSGLFFTSHRFLTFFSLWISPN